MAAETIKGVKIKFGVDNTKANAELKKTQTGVKNLQKNVKTMGQSFSNVATTLAGFALVTGAVTKSIKLAVDAEETHSKLLAVFNNNISETSSLIKDLTDNYIMSTAGAEKMVAATGDILTGFGFTQKSALDLSGKVAKLGADLASFTNIEGGAETAVKALTAAMVGETERAKALGIVIRQDSKHFKELVKEGMEVRGETLLQAKAMAALTIATEQSKNAIGDVSRTSDSTANVLKQFNVTLEDLATDMAKVFLPALREITKAIQFMLQPFDKLYNHYNRLKDAQLKSVVASKDWNAVQKTLTQEQRNRLTVISKEEEERYEKQRMNIWKTQQALQKAGKWTRANELGEILLQMKKTKNNKILTATYTRLIKEIGFVRKATKENIKTINKSSDATEENKVKVKKQTTALEDLAETTKDISTVTPKARMTLQDFFDKGIVPGIKKTKDLDNKSKDLNKTVKEVSTTFENVKSAIFGAVNVLESLKIVSGKTAQTMGSFANVGLQVFKAFKSGTLADKINAVANAVATVGEAIIEWLTGDGVGEAIDRENAWMNISDELEDQLRDLEKQIGNTHAATSLMLDELMDGQVTLQNSDMWLKRIKGTLSDLDSGIISAKQATDAMGKSFETWLSQAKELGTTGSKEFFAFIDDLQSRGLKVAEVNDFIVDSIKQGFEGYKQYLEGDFSDATIGVFEDMLAYEKKVADNQALVNGIKGLENALFGMSDAMQLNEEQFDQFEQAARDGYDELIAQGFSGNEALGMMAPTLQRLKYLQDEFGLTVDDATQKLIDEADASGLLKTDPIDRMATAMERFIELLSVQLGLATETAIEDINELGRSVDDLGKGLGDLSPNVGGVGKIGPGFASGANFTVPEGYDNDTFPMRVSSGEHVRVTPKGQSGAGGDVSRNIQVIVNNNSGDDIIDTMIYGFRNNVRNLNGEANKALGV